MARKPTRKELEEKIEELEQRIAGENHPSEKPPYLHFLESMELINEVIREAIDLEQMMSGVLETVLTILRCDRAWLIFPCDPDAPTWSVPMERTRPEYPGSFSLGKEIDASPEMVEQFRAALESRGAIVFDPSSGRPLPDPDKRPSTQSAILMAIYPRTGKPWLWGLSQCSHLRIWTEEDRRLFSQISLRLTDALSSLLFLRNLRESEEKYRELVENANSIILKWNRKGEVLFLNEYGQRFFGFADEEIPGRPVVGTIVPEMEEGGRDLAGMMESIFEHPEDFEKIENESVRKDGSRVWVSWTSRAIRDSMGVVVGMFSVGLDITDRVRAEKELRYLRNYLANIINSMPSVLVGVDLEGKVTQWNTAAEKVTGIHAKEAQGQSLEQVLPKLSKEMEQVRQAIRDRTVRTASKVPRNVDGRTHFEDVTVYPLVSNGVEGAVIRVDDVTERVRIEEMMVQSEKMLSVGGLAAGMAHEINNPLGAILQASQNVLRRISLDLPANARIAEECGTTLAAVRKYLEQREITLFLEDIRNGGLRAAQIVENMLSFSRKPDAEGSSTNLAELLDRTLLLANSDYDLKRRYDFRQIEIVREYHPDVPLVVCQTSKMQQVFLNILRNGAEAMSGNRDSGHVPRFVLRVLPKGPMVRVEIEDNGPGLDEATRRRVFEPFFTTKSPGIGTGLGLFVSYFIVTQDHGGTLSVESQPGVGSSFIIELPVEGYPHE